MITRELYISLATQMIQNEFLAVLGTAIEAFDAVLDNDQAAFIRAMRERGGTDVSRLALMLRVLAHPSSSAATVDLTDKVREHGLLERIEKVEMVLVRSSLTDACENPDHDHDSEQEDAPMFVFIRGTGKGEMPVLDVDMMTRFNLIVEDAMTGIGCTPDEIADMLPRMQGAPQEAANIERDMSAKLRAEIDQEVAEFRTTIDADLDKMFGGG